MGSPSPLEHTSHAKSSCAHSSQVEPRLLQPLSLSQQFSGQPRGLASFTQDPRTGMPSLWLNPLTPWGGSLPIRSPFSSETPPGAQVLTHLFFCPTRLHVYLSYRLGYIGVLLPVCSWNCSTCRCSFDVFFVGVTSTSSCSAVLMALFLKHLVSVSLSLLPESRLLGLDSSGGLKTDLLSFRLSLFYLLN